MESYLQCFWRKGKRNQSHESLTDSDSPSRRCCP